MVQRKEGIGIVRDRSKELLVSAFGTTRPSNVGVAVLDIGLGLVLPRAAARLISAQSKDEKGFAKLLCYLLTLTHFTLEIFLLLRVTVVRANSLDALKLEITAASDECKHSVTTSFNTIAYLPGIYEIYNL